MARAGSDAALADLHSGPEPSDPSREFVFSDADFRSLWCNSPRKHAGISLADNKRNLVYTRVSRRLRALGFNAFRRVSRLSRRQSGASWKASSTRSRPISPSSSASCTISIIFASSVVLPLARAARQPLPGLVGRLLDRRGAVHHRHRYCGARLPIPTATTSAFLRPISTPTCSPRPRAANIRCGASTMCPGNIATFSSAAAATQTRCSQAKTFAR